MDDFRWVAHLRDGQTMCEADGYGWRDVPDRAVASLHLMPRRAGLISRAIEIPAGARAVCFRRRSVAVSLASGEATPNGTRTVIGWTRERDARYWVIDDAGACRVVTDWAAI